MATTRTTPTVSLKAQPKATTTVEATTEVKLTTAVQTKLTKLLKDRAEAVAVIAEKEALKDDCTAAIRKIREATGASSIQFGGYTLTNVEGTQFDREATYKKLVALTGVTIEQIKACEVYKPKKAFEKITEGKG